VIVPLLISMIGEGEANCVGSGSFNKFVASYGTIGSVPKLKLQLSSGKTIDPSLVTGMKTVIPLSIFGEIVPSLMTAASAALAGPINPPP
jgi:hypothetical protein